MGVLTDYMADNGLSYESMAELLSDKLGKQIKPHGVLAISKREDRNLPKSWLDALELERPEFIQESPDGGSGDAVEPGGAAPGTGGSSPSSLPVPVELPFDGLEARKRIELVYVGVGEGVSRAMRDPRVAIVFRQHAPALAEKWIAAAKQNARIATVVTYVTAGGATGDLIIAHVMLVMSLLVITGKVPIGGILGGLGPDAVVPSGANGKPQTPAAADRPAEPGAVRAVDDDAEAPSR